MKVRYEGRSVAARRGAAAGRGRKGEQYWGHGEPPTR